MLIDEVAKEFKELWGNNFDISYGSDDCTYTATFYGNNNTDEIDYIYGSNCIDVIKKAIKETIDKDGFHIHECMQVYLDCDSTEQSKHRLELFYPIEERNVNKYIDKYNSTAKYWKINISITDIEDNCGWQFLEFPRYDLTDETIENLKKELNQGDDKMIEKYERVIDDHYWYYWHILKDFGLSDFLQLLQLNVLTEHKDLDVKKVISMAYEKFGYEKDDRELYKKYIATNQRTGEFNRFTMDEYDEREWYINEAISWIHRLSIEELRDIIYHHRLRDIQDEEYINDIKCIEDDNGIKWDANLVANIINEHKTKKLIEEIKNEQDNIIELSGSPVYTNPKSNFNEDSELVPQGNFPYMVEFFSDLIVDDDTTYQGNFGVNSKYIKDAMKLITQVENRAEELTDKYADKGIKVTVNGLNDGCEKGMAIYVWIPYQ